MLRINETRRDEEMTKTEKKESRRRGQKNQEKQRPMKRQCQAATAHPGAFVHSLLVLWLIHLHFSRQSVKFTFVLVRHVTQQKPSAQSREQKRPKVRLWTSRFRTNSNEYEVDSVIRYLGCI
jgi:hypothetical protein